MKIAVSFFKGTKTLSLEDEFRYLDDMVIYHLMSGLGSICTHTAVDILSAITVGVFSKYTSRDHVAAALL